MPAFRPLVAPALRGASAFAALLIAAAPATLRAQADSASSASTPTLLEAPAWVGTTWDDYERLMQLTGAAPLSSRLIRPLTGLGSAVTPGSPDSAWANPWGARAGDTSSAPFRILSPLVRIGYNSAVPYGMNDGALWQGKGLSTAATAGAELRYRILTVRVAPTVTWSENSAFALAPLVNPPVNASPYADHWLSGHIDRPQRFGRSAYHTIDAGESVIRLDWRALSLGAGTESQWWGPGIENAILMTNNAAGMPHAFIGTGKPVDIWIGKVEAMYTLGRLYDSDYWRTGTQPDRNRRFVEGLAATFEPRGAPGLYLGGGRLFYEYIPAGGIGFSDLVEVLQPFQKKKLATPSNPNGDDKADQLLALWGRWVFPESGFEVYGEWGRNDHSWNGRDFIVEPDHATGFVLGFQKVFRQAGGFLRMRSEMTVLSEGRTAEIRAAPSWYAHHIVLQGYTNYGQVVGAGIGPGSDMQSFHTDWVRRWGSVGAYVERIRDNSDSFYAYYGPKGYTAYAYNNQDVWLTGGVQGTMFVGPMELSAKLARGVERNRYTTYQNDVGNIHAELSAAWRW